MKKLLISLSFLILFFTNHSVADALGSIHEYTVDLYYANGVLAGSKKVSEQEWNDRTDDLQVKYPSLKKALKYGEAKLAYNATYLYGAGDFFESFLQYASEHPQAVISWELVKIYIESKLKFDAGDLIERLAVITSEITLAEQREAYSQSIKRGHGVITVAHSQGNFFTNQVFDSLESWMKPYAHMIAVASPSKSVFRGGAHVTFDNDMITIIPGNLGYTHTNPNRKGYQYKDGSYSDELSAIYHGFNYYMGEEVTEHDGKNGREKVSTKIARRDIEKYIINALDTHLKEKSQWEKKKDYGCLCKDKRIIMKHKWDTELSKKLASTKVFEFDEDGKLYHVLNQDKIGLEYARSTSRYGASVENIEEGEACYELVNYDDGRLGTIEGPKDISLPKNGVVEVTVTWDNPAIDFDLKVGWDAGVHDVKDTGCPMEHFYVETEYDIYPGTYPIKVTYKKEDDNESSLIPEKVRVMIKVPGKPKELYTIKIDSVNELEIGHVADIHVKYVDGKVVPEIEPDKEMPIPNIVPNGDGECHVGSWCNGSGGGSSGGGGGGGGGGGSGGGGGGGSGGGGHSCGDVPCEYKIIPFLQQLLFGPISGADLKLYRVSDKSLLYTGKTSEGNTLYTAGNIEVPDNIISQLDDDSLYLLEASEGVDIDHDDDMRIDDIPTVNQGTMHLLITGKQVKEIGFKMNVLTEIAYQVSKDMLDVNTTQEIVDKLHEVSLRLLKERIYRDVEGTMGYKDLLYWLPTIHQNTLFADYIGMVKPLIDNLFANRDIYEQAYKIVYDPVDTVPLLQSKRYDIDEELSFGSVVGGIEVLSEGDSSIEYFTLMGEGNENFTIEKNGTITVAQNATLDYEEQTYYRFYVTATTKDGISQPVEVLVQLHNIQDSPELLNAHYNNIYENTSVGDVVLEVSFNQGTSSLQSAELFGESNEYFEAVVHDNNVSIKVLKPLLGFLTHRAYRFELQVLNETEKSKKIPFTVVLKDRRDIPRLANTKLYVDENTAKGTIVGNINIISDGYSPIDKFEIIKDNYSYMEWPDGYFVIEKNGTIKVDANASLDYELKKGYKIYVKAINAIGESKQAYLEINLNNIPDTLPHCQGNTVEIDPINKSTAIGTTLGSIYCYNGDSPLISARLEPSSPFEAIVAPRDGVDYVGNYYVHIKLASSLKNIDRLEYNLSLSVTNATGESNTRPVHIAVDKNNYIFEMNQGDLNKILGKISVGDKTISYVRTDNGHFSVDKNGTMRRNDRVNIGAYVPQYTFKISIVYDDQTTEEIGVLVNVKDRIISTLSVNGVASKIMLNQAKTRAYITNDKRGNKGLVIADIKDPYNPKIISSLVTDGKAKDLVLSKDEKYLYLLDAGKGLKVIDISDENNPQMVSSLDFNGKTYQFGAINLSDDGNTLYMAHNTYGIEVIDVSNPLSLETIQNIGFLGVLEEAHYGGLMEPGGYFDVVSDDNILYAVDRNYGLQVIDISDLENPVSVYAESLQGKGYVNIATDIYLHKEEKLISILTEDGVGMYMYSMKKDGDVQKIKLSSIGVFDLLDNNIAYSTQYVLSVYDAYNPTAMTKMLYLNLGIIYGMSLDKGRNMAFVANGAKGMTVVDLTGIEQPVHDEPVVFDTSINILESDIPNIIVGDSIGQVIVWDNGDSPIANIWLDVFRDEEGYIDEDCHGLDGADPYYLTCENDYTYFNIDTNGSIMINDAQSLLYGNIGNQAPFVTYVENENGKKSNEAIVIVKIKENPDRTLKFQKSIIRIDDNISVGTSIGNVLLKKSERELFLFDMYEHKNPEYESCNRDMFYDYYYDQYHKNPESIYEICQKPEYFSIDDNGNIIITEIPAEGNYSVNIFAVDRFGIRVLENQKIEVLKSN